VGTSELWSDGSFSGQCRVEAMVLASLFCAVVSLFSVLCCCCTRGLFGGVWKVWSMDETCLFGFGGSCRYRPLSNWCRVRDGEMRER